MTTPALHQKTLVGRSNTPAHRRMREASPHAPNVQRGKIKQREAISRQGEHPREVLFMFNPSMLSFNYQASQAIDVHLIEDDSPAYQGDDSITASFELLFDRTFDVLEKGAENTMGVYNDVNAFERLSAYPPFLSRIPLRFIFGIQNGLVFDGYISSYSVQYTHFAYTMVPTRAKVSVQAAWLAQDALGAPNAANLSGSSSHDSWRSIVSEDADTHPNRPVNPHSPSSW